MKQKILAAGFVVFGTILAGCGGYGGGYGGSYVRYGPPPPRYGVIGRAPGAGYVWTDGYWDWRGSRYSWVDGRWQRPPRRGSRWEAPHWRQEGRGWRFRGGRWR
jgi:hypothetical protein